MSLITAIWSAGAGICLTLAGVHLLVWLKSRASWANLLFAISATAAAVCAGFELKLMHSETPAQFGVMLRWFHVPMAVLVVSLIWFVRQYLRSGRLWLLWLFCGLRAVTLTLTFSLSPNLNFREITGLHTISAWGDTIVTAVGVKNPWTNITHASAVVFLVFVVDAAIAAWRKGRRRQAVVVGTTFSVAAVVALTFAELLNRGGAPIPFTMSLAFLIVVVGMAWELSMDLLNANRLARELRENQERMTLATNAAELGLWEWDIERDEIWATEKTRERAGVGVSERINFDRFLQSVHPDDREPARLAVRQALEAGDEFEVEYRRVNPGGETRSIAARGRVERSRDGKPLRVRGITVDITERKLAEDKLRLSEERLRRAQGIAQLGYWQWDIPNDRITWSDEAYRIYGLDPEAPLTYEKLLAVIHPEDRENHDHTTALWLENRGGPPFEYRIVRPDGTTRWIHALGEVECDETGAPIRFVGVLQDITERVTAELEVHELRHELALVHRASTMGVLASALAHELNQPLGAILRNAEAGELFLQQNPPDHEELGAILADIRQDDQRAGAVIDRMRSLLKRQKLVFEPLSLKEVLDQVGGLMLPEVQAHKASMQTDMPVNLPLVLGNRVELQQVLMNLFVNGLDAMGRLPAKLRILVVRARPAGDQSVEVAVCDRGHGISADHLTRVFEPLFTTKSNGLGMGLAISRMIIESHGGRIWAEDNPEGGAAFKFTLKVADTEAQGPRDEGIGAVVEERKEPR